MTIETIENPPRRPEDFARARAIVIKRVLEMKLMSNDPELFVEFPVIIEALAIAERLIK